LVGSRSDAADEILDQLTDFEGRLRWLGNVETDDLVNLYDGSAFTVYPSVFEGFGIPLLESIRRGKAIVTSTGSCFEEIAGTAALYANPESIEEISAAILQLSDESNLRKQLEANTIAESKRFNPEILFEQTYVLYEKIIS
jgi:glycosyltransferase involved in cell wall biosynthesis